MLISNKQFGSPGGAWDQYVQPSFGLNFSAGIPPQMCWWRKSRGSRSRRCWSLKETRGNLKTIPSKSRKLLLVSAREQGRDGGKETRGPVAVCKCLYFATVRPHSAKPYECLLCARCG